MCDCECPYCGEGVEICHDDGAGYDEGVSHQQECQHCEKVFVFTTAIHFTYSPSKADCLNGAPHEYERTNTFPREAARLRCVHCDDEKPLPAGEALNLMNARDKGG